MQSDWPEVSIEEIAENHPNALSTGPFGSAISSKFFVDSGVPVIRGSNLSTDIGVKLNDKGVVFVSEKKAKEFTRSIVRRGDLIFTCWGTINQIGMIHEQSHWREYVISNKQMKLTVDTTKADPKFIYYVFSSPAKQNEILANGIGAAVPGFNLGQLKKHTIKLPPLATQRRIVQSLDLLDSKIQLNQQVNQTLEQMAQAIFKSWFVDFEPVKAKIAALAAGGSEEDALLAAMSAISGKTVADLAHMQGESPEQYAELRTTAELFPSTMQDSELEEIPEGWEVSEIGDDVTVVGGGTPSTKNPDFWEDGDIHWTSPRDLSRLADKILIDTDRKITAAGLAKISSGLLPIDTVLMSSRAPVGYLALAKTPVAVNQGYIAIKCEKRLSPEFVLQWCVAHMDEIKSRASGTTFAEISKKNFNIITVALPPKEVVSDYSEKVRQLYLMIENKVRESESLGKVRDALLPKLLSGELSVPDAEAQLAEAEENAHV